MGALGALGRALSVYEIMLHAFVYLSNHMHLLLTAASNAAFSGFMCHLNRHTADVARETTQWVGTVFGPTHNAAVLDDASAIAQLQYILANSVKEGLVDDPRDWPGPSSTTALLDGTSMLGRWTSRTAKGRQSARSVREELYEITLAPLPSWTELPSDERCRRVGELMDNAVALARVQRGGRRALGVDQVLAQDPLTVHELPDVRRAAPIAHSIDPAMLEAHYDARRSWGNRYRTASDRYRRDPMPPQFPPDCYLPPRCPASGRRDTDH